MCSLLRRDRCFVINIQVLYVSIIDTYKRMQNN